MEYTAFILYQTYGQRLRSHNVFKPRIPTPSLTMIDLLAEFPSELIDHIISFIDKTTIPSLILVVHPFTSLPYWLERGWIAPLINNRFIRNRLVSQLHLASKIITLYLVEHPYDLQFLHPVSSFPKNVHRIRVRYAAPSIISPKKLKGFY